MLTAECCMLLYDGSAEGGDRSHELGRSADSWMHKPYEDFNDSFTLIVVLTRTSGGTVNRTRQTCPFPTGPMASLARRTLYE